MWENTIFDLKCPEFCRCVYSFDTCGMSSLKTTGFILEIPSCYGRKSNLVLTNYRMCLYVFVFRKGPTGDLL